MDAMAPERSRLAEALAQLDEAMRPTRGSSSDPERRRVAARLSDLARCEDDELEAFARRHLPGRAADVPALRAARAMILAIGRVLGPEGESAEALGVLQDAQRALEERLADAKKAVALREAEAEAAAASAPALPEPPAMSAPALPEPPAMSTPALPEPPAMSAPPAASAGPSSPDTPPRTAAPRAVDEVTATLPLDGARLVPDDAMPFKGPSPAAFSTIPGDSEASSLDARRTLPSVVLPPPLGDNVLPFVIPTEAPREEWRAPPPLDRSAPGLGAGALPFLPAPVPAPSPGQAPSPAEVPSTQSAQRMKQVQGISLAQYAEICAQITALPDQVVQIRCHHGMDVHAWTALHALWRERFQNDPTLEPRWEVLVQAALVRLQR